jgi:phage-related minor tail protein
VGATEARVEGLQENAKGNVYDSGNIIPFAAGGVINKPTVFPFAGGTGLMGEDGPEAILPLHRDSSGELGVKSGGGGGEVNITIINNSGEEVRQEEKENQFGGKDIEIMIGNIQKKKLSDGSMDHVMKNRYGLKPRGKAV